MYIGSGILIKHLFFQKVRWGYFALSLLLILILPIGLALFISGPFNEHTLYAPQYKEQIFDSIHPGMLKIDVVKALGPPLVIYEINTEGRVGQIKKYEEDFSSSDLDSILERELPEEIHRVSWWYTRQGKATSDYHLRKIVFSKNGVVTDVVKAFYLD